MPATLLSPTPRLDPPAYAGPRQPPHVLRDRVVLVTGAASAIGSAMAEAFAAAGARVVLSDVRTPTPVVNRIRAANGVGFGVRADLAEPAAPGALVRASLMRFGRVDLVVHHPDAGAGQAWQAHLHAGVGLAGEAVRLMLGKGGGLVLLTGGLEAWTSRRALTPGDAAAAVLARARRAEQAVDPVRGVAPIPALEVAGGQVVVAPASPHASALSEIDEALNHLAATVAATSGGR